MIDSVAGVDVSARRAFAAKDLSPPFPYLIWRDECVLHCVAGFTDKMLSFRDSGIGNGITAPPAVSAFVTFDVPFPRLDCNNLIRHMVSRAYCMCLLPYIWLYLNVAA